MRGIAMAILWGPMVGYHIYLLQKLGTDPIGMAVTTVWLSFTVFVIIQGW